jgi:hypothetical protein
MRIFFVLLLLLLLLVNFIIFSFFSRTFAIPKKWKNLFALALGISFVLAILGEIFSRFNF